MVFSRMRNRIIPRIFYSFTSEKHRRYPTQIEHLPAQNILTSNVVLRVLYRGTPTNTIVVGDLLTFRLEARGQCKLFLRRQGIFFLIRSTFTQLISIVYSHNLFSADIRHVSEYLVT
jgi:hypothetical protein